VRETKKWNPQWVIFAGWSIAVIAGFWRLTVYSTTAGEEAKATSWPIRSAIQRDSKKPTLVVFFHPNCPCSAATLEELERLIPYIKNRAKTYIVFYKPRNRPESRGREGLWKRATSIPFTESRIDDEGSEIQTFGAKTSGQVFLFDPDGKLVFKGGITPARGHAGDSEGKKAILTFMTTGKTRIFETPVFGCSLGNLPRLVAGERK
jgi:hypothetical protein